MYFEYSNTKFITYLLCLIIFNFIFIKIMLEKLKIKALFDFPDKGRKIHEYPVAKIGGLILIINFLLSYTLFFEIPNKELFIFLIFLFFVVGFIDDLIDLNPYLRLIFITIIISLFFFFNKDFILFDVYFETFDSSIRTGKFNFIFTVFCIVAIINAFNLFDGLNGLSLSYFVSIFLYLVFKFGNYELTFWLVTCIVLLYFNLKNKLFLGDSGVYILSSYLGLKLIEIHNERYQEFSAENIFLLLMIPGIDMLRVFFERIINKKMFLLPDKSHLHHYLYAKFGLSKTLLILITLLIIPILVYEKDYLVSHFVILMNVIIYTFLIIYLKKNVKFR